MYNIIKYQQYSSLLPPDNIKANTLWLSPHTHTHMHLMFSCPCWAPNLSGIPCLLSVIHRPSRLFTHIPLIWPTPPPRPHALGEPKARHIYFASLNLPRTHNISDLVLAHRAPPPNPTYYTSDHHFPSPSEPQFRHLAWSHLLCEPLQNRCFMYQPTKHQGCSMIIKKDLYNQLLGAARMRVHAFCAKLMTQRLCKHTRLWPLFSACSRWYAGCIYLCSLHDEKPLCMLEMMTGSKFRRGHTAHR